MSARARFVDLALAQLGRPVLWGARGAEAFDCSGLVAWALRGVGGPDLRASHTAQRLHDESRALAAAEQPLAGDLLFYGRPGSPPAVVHVAIYLGPGRALSADGATPHALELEAARADPHARVRLHTAPWRRDQLPAAHRNVWLDALDGVSR